LASQEQALLVHILVVGDKPLAVVDKHHEEDKPVVDMLLVVDSLLVVEVDNRLVVVVDNLPEVDKPVVDMLLVVDNLLEADNRHIHLVVDNLHNLLVVDNLRSSFFLYKIFYIKFIILLKFKI
jgi:hypothetical protein